MHGTGSRTRVGFLLALLMLATPLSAHEGHDHDKPPPLNLPVAPRVVAVTPELELVGVSSGRERLTVFLHAFESNEPVKGAKMTVSVGENAAEASARSDGVFEVTAPWLGDTGSTDLVFALTLADGAQDLLTGRLERPETGSVAPGTAPGPQAITSAGWMPAEPQQIAWGIGGLMAGALLALLFVGRRRTDPLARNEAAQDRPPPKGDVTPLRRGATAGVVAFALLGATSALLTTGALAAEPAAQALPTIPPSMATDLPQRMPDGSLFVPKATQHLLSVRTMLTRRGAAPRTIELTGTVIPGPEHFGRVQPGRPGRIEAPPGGLAFIGKRVEKGDVLAYVKTYVEAADRANIDSLIAETEARIEKNATILSRYERSPGSVPQVKVDEVRGELDALRRKRAELVPSMSAREPVVAPISGIVSVATATIGQIVEGRDVLFEIVDPSQFWIEAVAYDAKAASGIKSAVAVLKAGQEVPLTFAGRGLVLRQQATVLTFRVPQMHDGLSIGMPVKVILQSTVKVDGFVVPASAVVRGQTGLPIVWIKTQPERFEPQTVTAASIDGGSSVVTAGLKADLRIVTDGVTLLNQVR